MRKRPGESNHGERPPTKRLKSTILGDTTSIVHAERGIFHVNEYPYIGYTITTTAPDTVQMGKVMTIANGFWPPPIVLLVCGYLTETHTYKCGINEGQSCCESWGCAIQDVRRMAGHAAEDVFLANLVGKSFRAFRWSLTPRSCYAETGGEGGGAADVELILNNSASSSGREVVTFQL